MQSIVILLNIIYNSIILGFRHISVILVRQFQFFLPSFPPLPFLLLSIISPMSLSISIIYFSHSFSLSLHIYYFSSFASILAFNKRFDLSSFAPFSLICSYPFSLILNI